MEAMSTAGTIRACQRWSGCAAAATRRSRFACSPSASACPSPTRGSTWSVLEDCLRDDLNERAERRIAVLDPVKLIIDNFPEGSAEDCFAPNHPQRPELGRRALPLTRELWIEREDFQEHPPKGYFRLSPGAEVRLRYGYVIRCVGVDKDEQGGHHGRALHLRSGHPERHAGRRDAQGQGQHPLAFGAARAARRSAAVRSTVRGGAARTRARARAAMRRRRAAPRAPASTRKSTSTNRPSATTWTT